MLLSLNLASRLPELTKPLGYVTLRRQLVPH